MLFSFVLLGEVRDYSIQIMASIVVSLPKSSYDTMLGTRTSKWTFKIGCCSISFSFLALCSGVTIAPWSNSSRKELSSFSATDDGDCEDPGGDFDEGI